MPEVCYIYYVACAIDPFSHTNWLYLFAYSPEWIVGGVLRAMPECAQAPPQRLVCVFHPVMQLSTTLQKDDRRHNSGV